MRFYSAHVINRWRKSFPTTTPFHPLLSVSPSRKLNFIINSISWQSIFKSTPPSAHSLGCAIARKCNWYRDDDAKQRRSFVIRCCIKIQTRCLPEELLMEMDRFNLLSTFIRSSPPHLLQQVISN